jgi:hypothetical protein
MADTESRRQPVAVKQFFDAVGAAAGTTKTVTSEAARAVLNDASIVVPHAVQTLLEKFKPEVHGMLLDSVQRGMADYRREHGFDADPSLVEFALDTAIKTASPLKELNVPIRLDSATNAHHDQISLQPATAMVAIMAQLSEAIPFAAYLSADVKSNEARLAIMDNKANSSFGDYAAGDSLNGIAGGGAYVMAERVLTLTANGGAGPFAVTAKARTNDTGAATPLLRGRTVILVNGIPRARDVEGYGAGSNAVAGSVTIAGTTYNLGGTVNTDTGALSITTSAALPAGTVVEALVYIDFEKAPQLAPEFGTEVNVYKMFAYASRGIAKNTIDSMTQMQNELALDPRGQAMLSIRSQVAQERHYRAIKKMIGVAKGQGAKSWTYDYTSQIAQKDRSQIWMNLMPILAAASQEMANATIDHGITTLYFTGELAAQLRGLPSSMFETSGITDRPGVYRLGRLAGLYECYYLPPGYGLVETGNGDTSQILCIGRATQVARNPIILGDAVPAVFLPLSMGADLVTQDGFYTRSFTELNPHEPSVKAAFIIDVTDIK